MLGSGFLAAAIGKSSGYPKFFAGLPFPWVVPFCHYSVSVTAWPRAGVNVRLLMNVAPGGK